VYKLIHIYTYTYNKMLRSQIIYNTAHRGWLGVVTDIGAASTEGFLV